MENSSVNVVMAFILIGIACGTILVLTNPCQMRRLADWLNARADAKDWNRDRLECYRQHREEVNGALRRD